jgi:hypothetical protein
MACAAGIGERSIRFEIFLIRGDPVSGNIMLRDLEL